MLIIAYMSFKINTGSYHIADLVYFVNGFNLFSVLINVCSVHSILIIKKEHSNLPSSAQSG